VQLKTKLLKSAVVGLALASGLSASAQEGYSVDIEFVRPSFGYGGFSGVDVPMTRKQMAIRYGVLLQYERDPLTLYNRVELTEIGAVVANRGNAALGMSMDVTDRFTWNVLLPAAFNWQTEVENFSNDGFGVGDLGVGARIIAIKTPKDRFNLGIRSGLMLPTGRPGAYMGESSVRFNSGLLAAVNVGPLRIATDAGLMSRGLVETAEDFNLGTEVQWGNGVRLGLPAATRTAFTGQVLMRSSLNAFLQGGAENAIEAIGGVQVLPSRAVVIDVGAGRGLTEGYGTTDFRILSQVTIQHVPEPDQEVVIYETPPPPPPPPPPEIIIEEPDPEIEWQEGELARVVLDTIQIREMLEFRVDTNILMAESRPTLQAIADLINADARIGHVVVEGHASQEGSFEHNYKLSESRAKAIFEELFKVGVHPERLSYRGMGEVVPIVAGEEEEQLQANRRVEFEIVKQFDAVEDMPDYQTTHPLPWNGELIPIVQPIKPETEEEKAAREPKLDEFGLPIDFDDEEEFDVGESPAEEDSEDTGETGGE
jgi:outer membrane protein OmpA-like peptidoglycan-associated protein